MNTKLSKSYYCATEKRPLLHTTAELLDRRGSQFPEKEALVIREVGKARQALTFGELKAKTEQLAAGMIKRGLKKGDSVGLFCSTSLEYAVCEYGLARTGAILIRFHVSVKTGLDLKHQMKKGNCKWLILHPGDEDENYKMLQTMLPGLLGHDPRTRLRTDDLPELESIFVMSSASYPGTTSWKKFFDGNDDADLADVRMRQGSIEMDDIQGCYATSGSTGFPKLVAWSNSQSLSCMRCPFLECDVDDTDVMLTDRPMPYAGGSSGAMLSIGLKIVFVKTAVTVSGKGEGRSFFFEVLEKEKCTTFLLFPYLLRDFLERIEAGTLDVSLIKVGFTGGELVQKPLLESILKHVPRILIVYGCTEYTTVISGRLEDSVEAKVSFTGRACFGEVKIVDAESRIVPVNTAGEICLRGPSMFRGYWKDEEKTRQAIDHFGWYKTGDVAKMNEEGYFTILGREKEVISKATIKIYPQSIEKELLQHPLVESAMAVGVPHEILFEEIALCVVPKKDAALTVDDLRQFCRERFRGGEDGQGLMPDYFLIFDKFPEGATNKTDRKKTRIEVVERLKGTKEN